MKNRRRGPDFVIKMIDGISAISWIVLAIVFLILIMQIQHQKGCL